MLPIIEELIGPSSKKLLATTYTSYCLVERVEKTALLYSKCRGIDEMARSHQSKMLRGESFLKFLKLGTPISSQTPWLWALSISRRVGDETLHAVVTGAEQKGGKDVDNQMRPKSEGVRFVTASILKGGKTALYSRLPYCPCKETYIQKGNQGGNYSAAQDAKMVALQGL